ncbi:uncharacterized protein LOC119521373 [Choloepus didactylus]|uniref:uncharacterized protein LOC119521373 n=1 Tax=Choloepus didactylus TaxID=27675 RepID=UPI00189EA958|nr:uncharacterized protein LOC119521373 [Choloepus didactylus]
MPRSGPCPFWHLKMGERRTLRAGPSLRSASAAPPVPGAAAPGFPPRRPGRRGALVLQRLLASASARTQRFSLAGGCPPDPTSCSSSGTRSGRSRLRLTPVKAALPGRDAGGTEVRCGRGAGECWVTTRFRCLGGAWPPPPPGRISGPCRRLNQRRACVGRPERAFGGAAETGAGRDGSGLGLSVRVPCTCPRAAGGRWCTVMEDGKAVSRGGPATLPGQLDPSAASGNGLPPNETDGRRDRLLLAPRPQPDGGGSLAPRTP